MVLEEATSRSNEGSFVESLPSSDVDQYAGDTNPTYVAGRAPSYVPVNESGPNQIYVNMNNLPRRWSLLGESAQPEVLAKAIRDSSRVSMDVLQRPLRQEEADALAFHLANGMSVGSYGVPIGVTAGFVQAWRRSKDFRFPGWTPGEKFNPDAFGRIKGPAARWIWHSVRFNAYGALGLIVGQVLFGSYALSLSMAGRAKDPRLREFNAELQSRMRERGGSISELNRQRENDNPPGPKANETYEMARQRQSAQEAWRRSRRSTETASSSRDDDMSPTGSSFGQEYLNMGTDSGLMTDAEIQQQAARERTESRRTAADGTNSSNQSSSSNSSSSARQRTADEASPTATAEASPKPAAGAWARLRQQAASGNQSSSGPRSSSSSQSSSGRGVATSNADDSFSFSQSEEDRQLAKSEAQKQFDARIEREREGKDFDNQGSDQRRW